MFCLAIIDQLLLFNLVRTYQKRLKRFQVDPDVERWREDQQREWDRLSQSLALLATMHAAILAIPPGVPQVAFAAWLGGASLAVCGHFIVQYFSVNSFGITDEDMSTIVDSTHGLLLAFAMTMPTLASCWSGIMFAIGIFDYVLESDMGGGRYRAIAFVPIGGGLAAVVYTLILGKSLVRKVGRKYNVNDDILETSDSASMKN